MGWGNLSYAIIVECAGKSTWFCDRGSHELEFACCGFYGNSADNLIDMPISYVLRIYSSRFADPSPILSTLNPGGVTFTNCWFSGAAPSAAVTNNCHTQETTASYAFVGTITYYCPEEAGGRTIEVKPTRSEEIRPTPSDAFTDPLEMILVRFVAMGLFVVPFELLW
jgi:hypothetical protein